MPQTGVCVWGGGVSPTPDAFPHPQPSCHRGRSHCFHERTLVHGRLAFLQEKGSEENNRQTDHPPPPPPVSTGVPAPPRHPHAHPQKGTVAPVTSATPRPVAWLSLFIAYGPVLQGSASVSRLCLTTGKPEIRNGTVATHGYLPHTRPSPPPSFSPPPFPPHPDPVLYDSPRPAPLPPVPSAVFNALRPSIPNGNMLYLNFL